MPNGYAHTAWIGSMIKRFADFSKLLYKSTQFVSYRGYPPWMRANKHRYLPSCHRALKPPAKTDWPRSTAMVNLSLFGAVHAANLKKSTYPCHWGTNQTDTDTMGIVRLISLSNLIKLSSFLMITFPEVFTAIILLQLPFQNGGVH